MDPLAPFFLNRVDKGLYQLGTFRHGSFFFDLRRTWVGLDILRANPAVFNGVQGLPSLFWTAAEKDDFVGLLVGAN